ncbi:hypothetical protein AGR7A_pAt30003 [Agrobacterium deltaense NCPPB 1641]|uniref:Uncharacterized protein n=1 Tax=Agrobacterium deltaense NCPPB 1641 TaxID=1183425 RepID=A0A1S7UAD2_9HYPH|nr:hypothetical protein AGR7A_pAt30003 [Agrobacterium deltaense NCPPB 1641]
MRTDYDGVSLLQVRDQAVENEAMAVSGKGQNNDVALRQLLCIPTNVWAKFSGNSAANR